MSHRLTRREFVKTAAAGIALPLIVPSSVAHGFAAAGKVRHAGIGVQGMGGYDLRMLSSSPHCEVVALCDIDDHHLDGASKLHPKARRYNDFRVLFDKESKNIDSCHVTIPDHMHAPITMTAIRHGKNVYCQKPMCHELDEARKVRLAAAKAGVTTQMGIQIHSHLAYRTGVHLVRHGAIGKVKAVHTWADRAWSNNGRPKPQDPPAYIHWDLWLGVAPYRPWGPNAYHPKQWWSWLDFGTGNLGDMGCHLFDPVVGALDLGAPLWVRAECKPPVNETWPNAGKVFLQFPGTRYTDGSILMTWYDGGFKKGHHPSPDLLPGTKNYKLPSQGSIFLGTKGAMLLPHWSTPKLFPSDKFKDYEYPKLPPVNHWHSFIDACRGEGTTGANFNFAGPLTESVLLGNLAKRFPEQKLEWDAPNLRVTNFAPANDFTHRTYRKGWDIAGL